MVEIGKILTLDNHEKYFIAEQLEKDAIRYVYTIRVLNGSLEIENTKIFAVETINEEECLAPIEKGDFYNELLEEFKDIVADKVLEDAYKEESEIG